MSDAFDRIKGGLLTIIGGMLAPTDYHALYAATVVKQNADKTLDLRPDTPKLPGLQKVPIRLGIPGAVASIDAGARVLLGFTAGDPSKPVVELWESGTLVSISLNGGTVGLAKADHKHGPGDLTGPGGMLTSGSSGASDSNTTLIKVT